MSRTVYRILMVFHALCIVTASPAIADSASDEMEDRWVPSLAVVVGFTSQIQNGTVDSSKKIAAFGSFFDVPLNERVKATNQQNQIELLVGGLLEIETPRILPRQWLDWSPRLFVGGEVMNVSTQSRKIAREGDPSTLREPFNTVFPEDAVLGQGSATSSDSKNVLYGASIGIAFPVQVGDWRLSIKPSARYMNQKFLFNGILLDAERTGAFPSNKAPTVTVQLYGNESLDVHAFGPGLEIELEVVRVQSFVGSVFISGGAYNVVGGGFTKFSKQGTDNFGNGDYTAKWTADIDPWIFRGSVGMRISWAGMSSGWFGGGN